MTCNIMKWFYHHRATLNYSTDLLMLNGQQLLKELTCLGVWKLSRMESVMLGLRLNC